MMVIITREKDDFRISLLNVPLLLMVVVEICEGDTIITPSNPFAIAGQEFNLTCDSGNTNGITWFRDRSEQNFSCNTNDNNQSLNYSMTCVNSTRFILSISENVINAEHEIKWQCLGDKISEDFIIKVYYEPERNITLSGYNGSILQLKQNVTLRCSAQGGRPWANFSWVCGDKPMQASNYNTTEKSFSELSLHLNKSFSGQICMCKAGHPIWETPVTKSISPLKVYYASTEDPHISGYKSFQNIREGVPINLTCTVSDGYPLPSLTWICDGTVRESKNQSKDGAAEIVLPLAINRTLNGQQCVCNGTSIANYNRTSRVSFNVLYPPTVALFAIREQHSNGNKYNMYCQVGVGNPSNNTISWSQRVANTIVRINKDLLSLQSNSGHNLTLTGASYQDIGEYTCSVHNNVTDLNGNLLQNKSVSIQRNFSAVFTSSNGSIFHAINGKRLNVTIPFYCQPPINKLDQIMWFNGDNNEQLRNQNSDLTFDFLPTKMQIPFYQKSIRVDGQVAVMVIRVINYASKGNYVLKIRNMDGVQEQFQFRIEVNDPAQQTSIPLIIGCSVAGIVVVAIIVVVIICVVMKHKTSEDVADIYAEPKDTIKVKQRNRSNSIIYSEPWTGQFSPSHDKIHVKGRDDIPMASITPYAVAGDVQKLGRDPVDVKTKNVTIEHTAKPGFNGDGNQQKLQC